MHLRWLEKLASVEVDKRPTKLGLVSDIEGAWFGWQMDMGHLIKRPRRLKIRCDWGDSQASSRRQHAWKLELSVGMWARLIGRLLLRPKMFENRWAISDLFFYNQFSSTRYDECMIYWPVVRIVLIKSLLWWHLFTNSFHCYGTKSDYMGGVKELSKR